MHKRLNKKQSVGVEVVHTMFFVHQCQAPSGRLLVLSVLRLPGPSGYGDHDRVWPASEHDHRYARLPQCRGTLKSSTRNSTQNVLHFFFSFFFKGAASKNASTLTCLWERVTWSASAGAEHQRWKNRMKGELYLICSNEPGWEIKHHGSTWARLKTQALWYSVMILSKNLHRLLYVLLQTFDMEKKSKPDFDMGTDNPTFTDNDVMSKGDDRVTKL